MTTYNIKEVIEKLTLLYSYNEERIKNIEALNEKSALSEYNRILLEVIKRLERKSVKEENAVMNVNPYRETIELMTSENYKDRFTAEYMQTKIRYEKLKAYNNRIELNEVYNQGEKPKHDCSFSLLKKQQKDIGEVLHDLELRAIVEGIDLGSINQKIANILK